MLAIFVPSWVDTAYGKAVERAAVVKVESRPMGQSKACRTVKTVGQGAVVVRNNPQYVITWRSENPPEGRSARFTGYSCDRYPREAQRNVIRGPHHRVAIVSWLNADLYRVVLLCLLVGGAIGAVVYIAFPRGPRVTHPAI
ncbi:hypothetical protein OH802_28885 [Nocardioides sp. NBC_00850]|uniref:hypothetical protein n=1 Tax=Nocardioides sp. NBC_00850 TaxID=2976001 RepID=UPI00386E46DB|nr:hypothetical protein OH802_28885 [Nocardioides sp. NBC_00850]